MLKKVYILCCLQVLLMASVYSQTFPVSVSTNITPPYSTFLGDYVAPGSERLAVNIFLNDINRPELQARLRLRIEGQGILMETKPEFLPAPLILQGGVPERLISSDLAQYFLPRNLNFSGLSRQQFERSGQLPEGLYQICFEVLEYNRGAKVSNSGCTMAWLILNDPPLINLPQQGEKLRPQEPQFVTFQWTPRHTGSPNSAFSTEYEFTLVELWPENRNPNDAILTSPPIYQTTTQSTTLIYGPAETPLEPGRRYAFQLRAKSMTGIDELDLFKNQGRSQVHSFQYGDACNLPLNIKAKPISSAAFRVNYEPNPNHTAFSLRYRKANDPNATWNEVDSYFEDIEVNGLQPETRYEYQMTGGCGPFASTYSPLATVTTEAAPEINYACGLPPQDYDFGNNEPLPALNKDDILYAGDFDVKISEATGSAGTFSGKGTVVVPYLDNLAVAVNFSSISVNTDYRMTAGSMDVKGIGVDVLPDDITDSIDELDERLASVDETLDDVSDGLDVAEDIIDIIEEETGNDEESDNGETTDENSPEGTENTNTDNTNNSGNENAGDGESNNEDENNDSNDPDNSGGSEGSNDDNNSNSNTSDSTTYDVKIWFNEDNTEYANGETITIDYTSDVHDVAFQLKGYPESTENFKWRFMHNNVDHTIDVKNNDDNLDNFGLNIGSKAGDIKLIAEYDGKPIELTINVVRKEFALKSITAIDGNNAKRKAHWGEKLYLVNGSVDLGGLTTSEREIKYEAKITPDLDFHEFSALDLAWSYENQETTNLEQEFGVKTITRIVEEEETIIRTNVKAGYTEEKEMYVDVQWVDGKKRSHSFVPPALSTVLTKKMQDVDGNLKVLDQVFKFAGINFKVDPIKITGSKYNKQDDASRLYRQYEEGKVSGGVSAEFAPKVISFPPLAFLSRAGIVDVGLFFKADFKFFIEGGVERYSLVESTETIGTNPFVKGGCKGCMETGIIAKLLVAENLVNFEAKGSATGCLVGEVKFSLEDYTSDGKVYIPPVIIAGKVKISTKGTLDFTLVNFEKSMTITDQLIIYENE